MQIKNFFSHLEKIPSLKIHWSNITDCPTVPKFCYFSCEFELDNIKSIGTGESFFHHFAKLKSLSEAIERWALQNHKLKWINSKSRSTENTFFTDSNGLAFHLDEASALKTSIGELIERDAILRAYQKETRPLRFNPPFKWNLTNALNKWIHDLEDVYFLILPTKYDEYVITCIIEKKTFPHRIFGYGHSDSLDKAIEKSWTEAWRFFWNLIETPTYKIVDIENINSPLDHVYYHANNKINLNEIFHLETKDLEITQLRENNQIIPSEIWCARLSDYKLPGYVTKTKCSEVRQLYFGLDKTQKCWVHPIG